MTWKANQLFSAVFHSFRQNNGEGGGGQGRELANSSANITSAAKRCTRKPPMREKKERTLKSYSKAALCQVHSYLSSQDFGQACPFLHPTDIETSVERLKN